MTQRLYAAAARLRSLGRLELLAGQVLEKVLSLARADRGNVQLWDAESGALTIVAHHGFDAAFLDHFAAVDDDGSSCGRAARHGAQMVITDVTSDPGFGPHREIAAASGFRAVQSTPLADKAGRLVGVVSTHYPRPFAPSARDRRIIQRYADLAGRVLASRADAVPTADPGRTRHCTPGRDWFRFQKPVPADQPMWTAKQDSVSLPGQVGLPGLRHMIGLARWWHLAPTWYGWSTALCSTCCCSPPGSGTGSCPPPGRCSPAR